MDRFFIFYPLSIPKEQKVHRITIFVIKPLDPLGSKNSAEIVNANILKLHEVNAYEKELWAGYLLSYVKEPES